MQFQYNSDYPGLSPETGHPVEVDARPPREFPPAAPVPCAKITTRIFHPARNQVATVQNVLVRTVVHPSARQHQRSGAGDNEDHMSHDTLDSSSSDDLSDISDESMAMADGDPSAGGGGAVPHDPLHHHQSMEEERGYWVQRTIREAIYGRVLFAVVLRKRTPSGAANDNADWEVTDRHCAVKEMSWQHIRRERNRLAEDPIKEVAAMQYLRRWHLVARQQQESQLPAADPNGTNHSHNSSYHVTPAGLIDGVAESFRTMMDTNIMMPLDLLTDDRNLYSVMPYCDGGELFERLDLNERFTEAEARYWMHQVLNVSTLIGSTVDWRYPLLLMVVS